MQSATVVVKKNVLFMYSILRLIECTFFSCGDDCKIFHVERYDNFETRIILVNFDIIKF